MSKNIRRLQDNFDGIQQDGEKTNLFVFWMNETHDENIKDRSPPYVAIMKYNNQISIKTCYRIGKVNNKGPRPKLLKFNNEDRRHEFMSLGRALSNFKIVIKKEPRGDWLNWNIQEENKARKRKNEIIKLKFVNITRTLRSREDCVRMSSYMFRPEIMILEDPTMNQESMY